MPFFICSRKGCITCTAPTNVPGGPLAPRGPSGPCGPGFPGGPFVPGGPFSPVGVGRNGRDEQKIVVCVVA